MVNIIKNIIQKAIENICIMQKWLPRIYWCRCPEGLSHSAIVIFPYHPNYLYCGLVGVVEFKKKKQSLTAAVILEQIRTLVKELKNQEIQSGEVKFTASWILV